MEQAATAPSSGQTAAPQRCTRSVFLALALCLASLPAWAQSAPATAVDAASAGASTPESPAVAKPKADAPARSKADAAASATLAALLPHLAANDTIPLMDRSAMFAGDLSRLLANPAIVADIGAETAQRHVIGTLGLQVHTAADA